MKMQAKSEIGNLFDCMVVTQDNNNECKVDQPVKWSWSHKDIDHLIKENYDNMINVVALMRGDELFKEFATTYKQLKMLNS
jgi:hypothetical protein